ncbi:MAG: hypothetical protein N2044_00345 [Cyclobacteriaceae bacterium]|nr:hypothetical protein [Cyclobacteriaceae bacterium]MCX7636269.1 hypothetical protein [Cyclobacteriaceae bacterium]MDW8332062.1 hypothetical protein [Cyclobacteriaceae bacterium]
MSTYEKQQLELELRKFTSRNFEKPSECRNLEQIRYYVQELCDKIRDYERRFNYVPSWAYALLAQYNARQNAMIHRDFIRYYRQ